MNKHLRILEPLAIFAIFALVIGTYYVTINLNPATATPPQVASVLGTQAYPITLSEISTARYSQVKDSFLTYDYNKKTYNYNLNFNSLPTGDLSFPIIQIKHNGSSIKQSFIVSPSISPQVQDLEIDLYINGQKYALYTLKGDLLNPTIFIPKENLTTVELRVNNHTEIFFPVLFSVNIKIY